MPIPGSGLFDRPLPDRGGLATDEGFRRWPLRAIALMSLVKR